jgi:uncharacterized protein (DUF433 family)
MPRRRKHSRQGQRRVGVRGIRTPVKVLFENLGSGMSIDEVIEQFPVTRYEIDSPMAFVALSLDKAPSYG